MPPYFHISTLHHFASNLFYLLVASFLSTIRSPGKVQHQLVEVQHIQATSGAFAAIRSDGTVITWGAQDLGGGFARLLQVDLDLFNDISS